MPVNGSFCVFSNGVEEHPTGRPWCSGRIGMGLGSIPDETLSSYVLLGFDCKSSETYKEATGAPQLFRRESLISQGFYNERQKSADHPVGADKNCEGDSKKTRPCPKRP